MLPGEDAVLKLWYDTPVTSVLGTAGLNMLYGVASIECSDGTLVECVYLMNIQTNHGAGRCRDTDDGEYRLEF
jgi:hypothetical protein